MLQSCERLSMKKFVTAKVLVLLMFLALNEFGAIGASTLSAQHSLHPC